MSPAVYDTTGKSVSVYDTAGRLVWGEATPAPPEEPVSVLSVVTDRGHLCAGDVHTATAEQMEATYRTPHEVRATGTDPVLVYSNLAYLGATLGAGPNPFDLAASIEQDGALVPLTFNGSETVTVAPGATVTTDPAEGVTLTEGETVHVRTWVKAAAVGERWGIASYDVIDPEEGGGVTWGQNLTRTGTVDPAPAVAWGTGQRGVWPRAVLATTDGPVLATMHAGSSSTAGWGDNYRDATNTGSYGVRAADKAGIPYVHSGQGGDSYSKHAGTNLYRNALAYPPVLTQAVTHVIGNMGANDWQSTRPLLAMQRDAITWWRWWADQGRPYWQVLPNPHPSSTDGYTTVEGQTLHAQEWRRAEFCDWVRDGAPLAGTEPVTDGGPALRVGDAGHPLAGYVDFPALIETEVNSGLWRVDPVHGALTGDGLHFKNVTHDLLADEVRRVLGY